MILTNKKKKEKETSSWCITTALWITRQKYSQSCHVEAYQFPLTKQRELGTWTGLSEVTLSRKLSINYFFFLNAFQGWLFLQRQATVSACLSPLLAPRTEQGWAQTENVLHQIRRPSDLNMTNHNTAATCLESPRKSRGTCRAWRPADEFEWQIALLIKSRMQLPVSTKYLPGPVLLLPPGCE